MQPGIPAATTAAPAMTRPAQTGDPPQPAPDQIDRADSDTRTPGRAVAEDASLDMATGAAQTSESDGVLPEAGGDHERTTPDMPSSGDTGVRQKPPTPGTLKPGLGTQQSVDRDTALSGDLTISAVDLAALLQSRPSRGWLHDHAAPVIAALIGAWTVAMLAFMQQGFNDLKAEIKDLKRSQMSKPISRPRSQMSKPISRPRSQMSKPILKQNSGRRSQKSGRRSQASAATSRSCAQMSIVSTNVLVC